MRRIRGEWGTDADTRRGSAPAAPPTPAAGGKARDSPASQTSPASAEQTGLEWPRVSIQLLESYAGTARGGWLRSRFGVPNTQTVSECLGRGCLELCALSALEWLRADDRLSCSIKEPMCSKARSSLIWPRCAQIYLITLICLWGYAHTYVPRVALLCLRIISIIITRQRKAN